MRILVLLVVLSIFGCKPNESSTQSAKSRDCKVCPMDDDLPNEKIDSSTQTSNADFDWSAEGKIDAKINTIVNAELKGKVGSKAKEISTTTIIEKFISENPKLIENIRLERYLFCSIWKVKCKDTSITDFEFNKFTTDGLIEIRTIVRQSYKNIEPEKKKILLK